MRTNGFTLVEVLFALVAGSLLLVTLGWAIRGIEQQYRHHRDPSAAEKIEAIAPLLTTAIERARPPATGAAFDGTDTHLLLTVPPPRALGAVGLVRLDLTVASSRSGRALVARFLPASLGQSLPASALASVTLADGFDDIRFDYVRRANDPPTSLPRLITLQFRSHDGTVLPLGIEPRLTMAADCQFDSIALACRR